MERTTCAGLHDAIAPSAKPLRLFAEDSIEAPLHTSHASPPPHHYTGYTTHLPATRYSQAGEVFAHRLAHLCLPSGTAPTLVRTGGLETGTEMSHAIVKQNLGTPCLHFYQRYTLLLHYVNKQIQLIKKILFWQLVKQSTMAYLLHSTHTDNWKLPETEPKLSGN